MSLTSLVMLSVLIACTYSEAQHSNFDAGYYGGYDGGHASNPVQDYFRAGYPYSSFPKEQSQPEQRLFFSTFTLTIATSTSTSTSTVSTTCTTSTTALSVCSPSGRRRRTVNNFSRGIFYNEEEHEEQDGSIFTSEKKVEEPVVKAEEPVRETRKAEPIPYVIQPGFNAPEGAQGRFLLALGTSTVTTTTTSTYTAVLTANCISTTGFATCGASG